MKPVGLSRGRGIFLVDDLSTVSFTEPMIIQKYISNPLLIKGFKFDLRLYVLVTSFKPLECWISSLGFARFASKPYECSSASLSDTFIHLTNTSLQKDYEDHSLSDCLGGIIGEDGKSRPKKFDPAQLLLLFALVCPPATSKPRRRTRSEWTRIG